MPRRTRQPARPVAGFTLVELLIVVVLLGIAGAMVIPQMGSVGALRVQGAVRTLVSDLTFAQSDAIAFQQRRAIVFDTTNSKYTLVAVLGSQIDTTTGALYNAMSGGSRYEVMLGGDTFGGARIASADFGGSATLIFDDMGSPAAAATGDAVGPGGTVRIATNDQAFDILVEPYTGRVTVRRVDLTPAPPAN